jgi:hypothetical protein
LTDAYDVIPMGSCQESSIQDVFMKLKDRLNVEKKNGEFGQVAKWKAVASD